MDTRYISSTNNEHSYKRLLRRGNLIFSLFILTLFVIYMLLLSPKIETTIENIALGKIRATREVTLNYLTPLNNSEIYTQEYSLNTLATTDLFSNVRSKTEIRTEDPRVIAMQKFLLAYNSPMYPYAKNFIKEADTYGLDWRLVVSISGVESAFGNLIPKGTNNGWGWRGANTTAQGWSQFETWGDAIAVVTKGLALGYGVTLSPFQIEPTYCPPCGANPAHVWANGVSRYMRELDYYVDNLDRF